MSDEPEEIRNKYGHITHWIVEGETKTVHEWCAQYRISRNTVNSRLKRGWPIAKALQTALVKPSNGKGVVIAIKPSVPIKVSEDRTEWLERRRKIERLADEKALAAQCGDGWE